METATLLKSFTSDAPNLQAWDNCRYFSVRWVVTLNGGSPHHRSLVRPVLYARRMNVDGRSRTRWWESAAILFCLADSWKNLGRKKKKKKGWLFLSKQENCWHFFWRAGLELIECVSFIGSFVLRYEHFWWPRTIAKVYFEIRLL